MRNRKAKFLFAEFGQHLKISNRRIVRYSGKGFLSWKPALFYCISAKRSAAQNRSKNHCHRVESEGAQS